MNNLKNLFYDLRFLNFWYLLLFFTGIGTFLIGMPKITDDYWYMELLRPWFESQGIGNPENGGNIFKAGIPWKEIFDTWEWRFYNDNVRLGNLIAPFLLLLPKWFGSSLMLLCFIYAVMGAFRLFRIDWRRSLTVAPILACLFLAVPFQNHFGSLVFQINYIPPCALSVYLLNRLFSSSYGNKLLDNILIFVVSLLTAMWQEAFGMPLLCSIIYKWLVVTNGKTRLIISFIGLFLGIMYHVATPGIQWRIGMEVGSNPSLNFDFFVSLMFRIWYFSLATIVMILALFIRRIRRSDFFTQRAAALWILCFASLCLYCSVTMTPRVFWPGAFYSSFLSFSILRFIVRQKSKAFHWLAKISDMALMGLLCWSLVLTSIEVIRLRPQLISAVDTLAKAEFPAEVDHAYADIRYFGNYSPILTNIVISDLHFGTAYMKEYFDTKSQYDQFALIPSEFRDFSFVKGTAIPGEVGAVKFANEIIAPYDGPLSGLHSCQMKIDLGKGYVVAMGFAVIFRSEKDGNKYVHLIPRIGWYLSHFKTIRGVDDYWFIDVQNEDEELIPPRALLQPVISVLHSATESAD